MEEMHLVEDRNLSPMCRQMRKGLAEEGSSKAAGANVGAQGEDKYGNL
jgi:hypothetical protein